MRPAPGLALWASANTSKNIYMARLAAPYPGFPFKRLTIKLSNESGTESKIKKFQAIWLVVVP